MRFRIQTSECANPGDYDIRLVLTLGDSEHVETIADTVTVHVNSTREQLEPLPTAGAVLGALVALLSLVYTTGIVSAIIALYT